MNTAQYPFPIELLEEKIGYNFKNRELITKALTHSSYANELKARGEDVKCYERLEFLGDSVLSIITSDYIFARFGEDEGELTKIRAASVCEGALYEYSKSFCAGDFILLGHGEEITNGRERRSILADVFEAILAAIYLDGGYIKAKEFALPYVSAKIDELTRYGGSEDCKTMLQQFVQQNRGDILEYVLIREEGPAHDKNFFFEVRLNNNCIGRGSGGTKREAEQQAAREALILFGVLPEEKSK
jgi:ribonuclease-3